MFERYTEKARRVIFFARYEASQFGSPFIDTEHLLLGLLRDDTHLIHRVLPKVYFEAARQDVASRAKPGTKSIPTNVDLPLSEQAKRALIYAAEEAERLKHRHIGTEHLLLGLLREKEFASAEFLSQSGTTLESLRKKIEALGHLTSPSERSVPVLRYPPAPSTIEIHGVKRTLEHIRIFVSRYREYSWHWEQKPWKVRDMVMRKDGKGFSFDLSLAENSSEFVLVQGGWKKDHCVICRWELFESDDAPRNWIHQRPRLGLHRVSPEIYRSKLLWLALFGHHLMTVGHECSGRSEAALLKQQRMIESGKVDFHQVA